MPRQRSRGTRTKAAFNLEDLSEALENVENNLKQADPSSLPSPPPEVKEFFGRTFKRKTYEGYSKLEDVVIEDDPDTDVIMKDRKNERADDNDEDDEALAFHRKKKKVDIYDSSPPKDPDKSIDKLNYSPLRRLAYRQWLFRAYCEHQENAMVSNLLSRRLHTDQENIGQRKETIAALNVSGEDRFRMMIHVLYNGLCWKLKCAQVRIARQMIQSVAQLCIGEDWPQIGQRIMEEFGWEATPKIGLACMPRRFGKSTLFGCVQTSFAVTNSDKWQATIASVARQTESIRTEVVNTIDKSGYSALFVTRARRSETIYVNTIFKGELPSRMSFYPANEKISIYKCKKSGVESVINSPVKMSCAFFICLFFRMGVGK